ncbi:MAG TPA: hypothetical protein PLX89_14565 [Verrucomicrobiota bacterium]|nr:hypothetical protein [Verrucomicrobiales bacterium]HRI14216.1 hypothetical protein [Verrucomicrobiota bacterium]
MQHPDQTRAAQFAADYQTYRGLPPLAGLGSFTEAIKPGLSVEESVSRLKRHHYAFKRLHQIFIGRLTAEPVYELKMAFSYHAYLCAEHVSALRARVGEMREPPLGLDKVPHEGLALAFDEILSAPTTEELLLGIYEVALPALDAALKRHRNETHVLADQPTRRECAAALQEVEEMLAYGRAATSALVSADQRYAAAPALEVIRQAFTAAGGLDGTTQETTLPARLRSQTPWIFDGRPRRDARFPDPYNMGVNAEVFLYDASKPIDGQVLMMFYKRLREIDVPEMMASIIAETPDKPWAYYRDMTRQLWDEARHAMMGEVGFVSAGVDWPRNVMINFTWSLGLNSQLTPLERHAVLYFIEQGLMPKTGKRHEWEVGVRSNNALSATFQDFDWADEVLHARVGRDWYVSQMPSAHEAVAYGDRCWSKVLMGWKSWRDAGLTQHRNWWPDTYRQYCDRNGIEPNPDALTYAITYETTRADLKDISASA